jgi:hypothetical protein
VEAFYDWRNDLFFRRFGMTGKASVDYMTARRTYKVCLDDYCLSFGAYSARLLHPFGTQRNK